MTARRLNISPRKTPALTGGDERPTPACDGKFLPFFELIERPRNKYAREECLAICNATNDDGTWKCPLRNTCWDDNDHETWVKALKGTLPDQLSPNPCSIKDCDEPHSAKGFCIKHYRKNRRASRNAA